MQLAVDREVLKIIAKTREEICILRETYAARKASRKNSLQFGTESLNRHVFKVPQEGFRRSRRVKPSLVMREDHYYSSPRHKDAYGTVHNYATLEKREE